MLVPLTDMFQVHIKYILSTYQVPFSTNLQKYFSSQYKQVCTQLAVCCMGTHYAIVQYHLVQLVSCTYQLVHLVTILGVPVIVFLVQHIHC